jgi:hypothetical protein
MPEILITTLAERPEFLDPIRDFDGGWPKFMQHDPVGNSLMGRVIELFPDQCLVATEDGELIAHGRSIPFRFRTKTAPSCRPAAGTGCCSGGSRTTATAVRRMCRARWRS